MRTARDRPKQRKRTARDKRTSSRHSESAIKAALSAALSDAEIDSTLVAALLALDAAGMDRVVARLGADTGALVRSIVSPKHLDGGRLAPRAATTGAKLRQEWARAWATWEACVDESNDEDGKYVVQDHDWEAPYLDTGSIADDLEQAAAQIQPLLSRIIDANLCAPTFRFADVIRDTADEIGGGLPDWMDGSWDPAWFGPVATRCLLDAEWRICQRAGTGAFECVDALLALEQSLGKAHLSNKAIEAFLLGLPEATQREIVAGIDQHRGSVNWKRVLGISTSGWSVAARKLARRSGRARHRGRRSTTSKSAPAKPSARRPRSRSTTS
jgi:hypothetical protein